LLLRLVDGIGCGFGIIAQAIYHFRTKFHRVATPE
jgi:hypothetical protein